jgi:hypothetical protein
VVAIDTGRRAWTGGVEIPDREDEAMEYLRGLTERLGKALRIKLGARQTREVSSSADPLGPVEGPAPQARP